MQMHYVGHIKIEKRRFDDTCRANNYEQAAKQFRSISRIKDSIKYARNKETDVICEKCGGQVEWKGPLTNLTYTECKSCGGINCQICEDDSRDNDAGILEEQTSEQERTPTNHTQDTLARVARRCGGLIT